MKNKNIKSVISLSKVLLAQTQFDSSHPDRDLFKLEGIDERLAKQFVQLLKLIALQADSPIIADMELAYYSNVPHDQSVGINRILEKLSLQELLQLLNCSSLLQLSSHCNQIICHYLAAQLGSPEIMKQCLTSPNFLENVTSNLPEDTLDVLRQELYGKRG
jgi:hypothetical protein